MAKSRPSNLRKQNQAGYAARRLRPQLCRSADFCKRRLSFNADLQAIFLGMTTNNDRFPILSRHLTKRLR